MKLPCHTFTEFTAYIKAVLAPKMHNKNYTASTPENSFQLTRKSP